MPEEIGCPEKWEKEGRARLKEVMQREVFGRFPEYDKKNTTFDVQTVEKVPLSDMVRKFIKITANLDGNKFNFDAYMFVPEGKKNCPVFLHINRHEWVARSTYRGIADERFPLKEIIARGYAVIYYDTDSIALESYRDCQDFKKGIYPYLGIDETKSDNLGMIGMWAFAAMRVMDYLETDDDIDISKVIVMGHSRLAKTALLAGAMDERFAITISNSSGCAGAALFKTKCAEGEHVEYMARVVPGWFCNKYREYANNEQAMEFDMHYLLSLVAPRLLYVQSSSEDVWADPVSEFDACRLTSEVYEKVYGIDGLIQAGFPAADSPLHDGNIGYHVRTGDHNLYRFDWHAYMDFADKKLK